MAAKSKSMKKKVTVKNVKKKKTDNAFMKPVQISEALAKVVGSKPLPRTEVTKKLWMYIKEHDLQDKANRRNIIADANLKAVFGEKGLDV